MKILKLLQLNEAHFIKKFIMYSKKVVLKIW